MEQAMSKHLNLNVFPVDSAAAEPAAVLNSVGGVTW